MTVWSEMRRPSNNSLGCPICPGASAMKCKGSAEIIRQNPRATCMRRGRQRSVLEHLWLVSACRKTVKQNLSVWGLPSLGRRSVGRRAWILNAGTYICGRPPNKTSVCLSSQYDSKVVSEQSCGSLLGSFWI